MFYIFILVVGTQLYVFIKTHWTIYTLKIGKFFWHVNYNSVKLILRNLWEEEGQIIIWKAPIRHFEMHLFPQITDVCIIPSIHSRAVFCFTTWEIKADMLYKSLVFLYFAYHCKSAIRFTVLISFRSLSETTSSGFFT